VADRRNKTIRDMSISMGVIVVAVLFIAIFNGGFELSPGRPTGGTAATADVKGGFETAGRVTGFAVVVPKGVPAAWHGSSFSITAAPGSADAPPTARGGWLVPSGAYITLIESSGDPAVVLKAELGPTSGATTGSVTAGGASWTVGPGVRDETAWWRTQSGVTLVITGNASTADFTTLAGAVAN
jgi:hypothetical protein